MRRRLLDATIACVLDLGWAQTSTPEICKRAGVSRGAQLHHFPTKAELVITAVEHLYAQRIEEFRRAFAALPAKADPAVASIDLLWPMFSGPTFSVTLELLVAARTDPELRQAVAAMDRRLLDQVDQMFTELFPTSAVPADVFALVPYVAFAVMQWLAIGQILHPHDPKEREHRDNMLQLLKALAPLAFATRQP